MENNILRIDLDIKTKRLAVNKICYRLFYLNSIGVLKKDIIKSVTLIYKTSYSCKIMLNIDIKPEFIIIFQLLLGSDWKKESNTTLNHYILNMEYSNRMFDVKRYPNGEIITAKKTDITKQVISYINKNKKANN